MMKFLHKLFFETKMTWTRTVIFAFATAVVTALLLIWPATSGTSFENIGVSYECWFLFALIIIMNCEKPLEAGLKTFVFFLISQPLIYLFQVPFAANGWEIFRYYPIWFRYTLLCFPGAMVAWFVKKDNFLSALILSVATGSLIAEAIGYTDYCTKNFPQYLLTIIFCAALAVILIFALLQKKKNRIITGALTLIVGIAVFFYLFISSASHRMTMRYALEGDHTWEITAEEGTIGNISIDSIFDNTLLIEATEYGTQNLALTNENGETVALTITFDRKNGVVINEE